MIRVPSQHLTNPADLKTTQPGFRAISAMWSLEYERRADPFLAQAQALRFELSAATNVEERCFERMPKATIGAANRWARFQGKPVPPRTWSMQRIRHDCVSAKKRERIVGRFLLSRGELLANSMRNIGGFMAQKKFTRAVIAYLKLTGHKCRWLHAEINAWAELPDDDADVELWLRGLSWVTAKGPRTLLYNITVPLVRNNVDLLLFNCSSGDLNREIIRTPSAYLALGELKGGIDPAGADEHWKTARTALNRIHEAFAKQRLKPNTFFIGAAIETKMAAEIWEMLKRGTLKNAANLTDEDQIASITSWLCNL